MSISGGGNLDGVTQGDGSHLVGLTITLDSYAFEELLIRDGGTDVNFDDNDNNQRLDGSQSFDGASFANNTRIEAEYRLILRDPTTGIEYEALGINFNTTSPSYGTVEGLSFVDVIPPAGVALEVIQATEGPGSFGQAPIDNADIAVPACFTPGTWIETANGAKRVEHLRAGDIVQTLDHGPQPLIWVGRTWYNARDFECTPEARPILIRRDAFGPGLPCRDMRVSPQHRILVSDTRAELYCGETEVLAAAAHLVDGKNVLIDSHAKGVLYLHLQCAAHEVLLTDGLLSESFNPGTESALSFPQSVRETLFASLPRGVPEKGLALQAARPMVKRHEAALLRVAA